MDTIDILGIMDADCDEDRIKVIDKLMNESFNINDVFHTVMERMIFRCCVECAYRTAASERIKSIISKKNCLLNFFINNYTLDYNYIINNGSIYVGKEIENIVLNQV